MAIVRRVLLAILGLSAGVFGAAQPTFTTVALNADPTGQACRKGAKTCHDNFIFVCTSPGRWEVVERCVYPFFCDSYDNGTAGCALHNYGKSSPCPTTTPAATIPAVFARQPAVPHTGDRRCAGRNEEIYDETTDTWVFVRRCRTCVDYHDGTINCAPIVPEDPPVAEEIASPTQSVSPLVDNPCFGGEVLCSGDRVQVCTAERKWEDFGPCPGCKQLYNTRVKCNYEDSDAEFLAADFAKRYTDSLARTDPPAIAQPEKCNTGWERCAKNNTEVQVCDNNTSWRTIKTCGPDELCLSVLNGVVFCVSTSEAEAAAREIAN
ncbi:hypothetical protein F5Y04DRAFT_138850 [Hypomontagnella monticulosa]|nr:hypothetical protein F5Y04DRAFT_138850 [Hypomontagnella monticulosa]